MRMILGLASPNSGQMEVFGKTNLEQQRKYTGSLIEASMSARDNLETIRKEKGKAFFFEDAAADRTGHRSHKETRLSDFGRAD